MPLSLRLYISPLKPMVKRRRLAGMIRNAWRACISEHYVYAEVNSEAALQTLFCTYLFREFEVHKKDKVWRLFVEPRLESEDGNSVVLPDVLICNARRIVGAIELKYAPRVAAAWEKDMNTLAGLAKRSGATGLKIGNKRYLGPTGKLIKEYEIAEDALFVWASVSAKELNYEEAPACLKERQLLIAEAITSPVNPPRLQYRGSVGERWRQKCPPDASRDI